MAVDRAPDPQEHGRDRPANDPRKMLDGIFWTLSAGTRWRQLDSRFGPYQAVHAYFTRWRRGGVPAGVVEALQLRLDKEGLIDWGPWCVDGSNARASKSAAGTEKKSRPRAGRAGGSRPGPRQGWIRRQIPLGH